MRATKKKGADRAKAKNARTLMGDDKSWNLAERRKKCDIKSRVKEGSVRPAGRSCGDESRRYGLAVVRECRDAGFDASDTGLDGYTHGQYRT